MKTEGKIEQLNKTFSKKNQRKRHVLYLELKNNQEKCMLQVILIVAQRGTSNSGGETVVGEGSLLMMFDGNDRKAHRQTASEHFLYDKVSLVLPDSLTQRQMYYPDEREFHYCIAYYHTTILSHESKAAESFHSQH